MKTKIITIVGLTVYGVLMAVGYYIPAFIALGIYIGIYSSVSGDRFIGHSTYEKKPYYKDEFEEYQHWKRSK